MSLAKRRGMVDRVHPPLPIAQQCVLLGVSRSGVCYRPKETPFYGSRRMRAWLMRLMGLRAICRRPRTSRTAP